MTYTKEIIENKTRELVAPFSERDYPISFQKIIERVPERIGIFSAIFDEDGISWLTKKEWGDFLIYINSSEPLVRRRFSTAHELGHVILGHLSNESKKIDYKYRKNDTYTKEEILEEKEANWFASALLMPAEMMDIQIKKNRGIDLDFLADFFWVSISALKIRLFNLWYMSYE